MSVKPPPTPPVRRVITGHDHNKRSVVKIDDLASNHNWEEMVNKTLVWSSDEMPIEIWSDTDFGARRIGHQPSGRGTLIYCIDILPGNDAAINLTDTLDYIICLSGQIDVKIDASSTINLKAGELMVQQATSHAWVNQGSKPCRLVMVMIDAKREPGIGEVSPPRMKPHGGTGNPPNPAIKRLVTQKSINEKTPVFWQGTATNHKWSGRGMVATLIWSTDECPAEVWSDEDYGDRALGTQPPRNGSRFTINDYPPGMPGRMHRTDTLDIIIVMDGEIDMELDDGVETHIKQGDIMIQQGTNHAWWNRAEKTCRLAIILLDAKEGGLEITA
jgi:quercetin dioxygenase-like cupin family protein